VNLETLGLQHPNNRHWAEFNKFKKDLANVVKLRSVSILGIQICIKKPYDVEFDNFSLPHGWCKPDLIKFSGDVKLYPLWVSQRRRRAQGVSLNSGNKSLCHHEIVTFVVCLIFY
jgi:hypothetical protein